MYSTFTPRCAARVLNVGRNGVFGIAGTMGFGTDPTLVFDAWFAVIAFSAGDCESFDSD